MKDLQFAISNMKQMLASEIARLDFEQTNVEATLWVCTLSRRIGCGIFLAEGDASPAFEGLFRSGEIYLMLLEQLATTGEMTDIARGQAAPMTDALAVGAIALANRIDVLLPKVMNADLEDDEDFAWYSALHGFATGRFDAAALVQAGDELVASDSEFLVPRGELLRAVGKRRAGDFEQALARLTDEWHERIEQQRTGGITDRYADLTEWNLFLEGLAIVRAARAHGVTVQPMYPFLPAPLLVENPVLPEPLAAEE